MRGHLYVVTFLPHESLMCSFILPDIFIITQSWKIWHFCITPWNIFSKKFTWNRDWTCNPMAMTPQIFINSHALTTEITWQVLIERYLASIQKFQICQLCVITEKHDWKFRKITKEITIGKGRSVIWTSSRLEWGRGGEGMKRITQKTNRAQDNFSKKTNLHWDNSWLM